LDFMDLQTTWSSLKDSEIWPAMSIPAVLCIFLGIFSGWTPRQASEDILSLRRPSELVSALSNVKDLKGQTPVRLRALCIHKDVRVRAAAFEAVLRLGLSLDPSVLQILLQNQVHPSELEKGSSLERALDKHLSRNQLTMVFLPLFEGEIRGDSATFARGLLQRKGGDAFIEEVKAQCANLVGADPHQLSFDSRLSLLIDLIKPVKREDMGSLATLIEPGLPGDLLAVILGKLKDGANDLEVFELVKYVKAPGSKLQPKLRGLAAALVLEHGRANEVQGLLETLSQTRALLSGLKGFKMSKAGKNRFAALALRSLSDLKPGSRLSEIELSCRLLSVTPGQGIQLSAEEIQKILEKLTALTHMVDPAAWRRLAMSLGKGFASVADVSLRETLLSSSDARQSFIGLQLCELMEDKRGVKALESLAQHRDPKVQLQAALALVRMGQKKGLVLLSQLQDHPYRMVGRHARLNLEAVLGRSKLSSYIPRVWDRDDLKAPQSTLFPE
jgi:hypothetical protein